jgi:hypothetical protein
MLFAKETKETDSPTKSDPILDPDLVEKVKAKFTPSNEEVIAHFDMYGGKPGELEPVEDLVDADLVTVPRRHDDRDKEMTKQQALQVRDAIGFKGNVSASDSGKSWCIYRSSDGGGYRHTLTIPAPTSA